MWGGHGVEAQALGPRDPMLPPAAAFVTLLNGEQAWRLPSAPSTRAACGSGSSGAAAAHGRPALRANLPPVSRSSSLRSWCGLFGSLERCFLVYSERTGHPYYARREST